MIHRCLEVEKLIPVEVGGNEVLRGCGIALGPGALDGLEAFETNGFELEILIDDDLRFASQLKLLKI